MAVPFVVLAFLGFALEYINDNRRVGSDGGALFFGGLMTIFTVVVIGVGVINSLMESSDQTKAVYELEKIQQFERVYLERADVQTKKFASYLLETYPKMERDIFSQIKPGTLDIYLVKYPELQSSKTIMALVDQERQLRDAFYGQQLERATLVRQMNYRAASPWVFKWMLPNVTIPVQ
jgi:hypothetical protein